MRALARVLPSDLDAEAIAARAELPFPLVDVPLEACDLDGFRRLWRAIMSHAEDPTLPFELGAKLPFGAYEVIDYLTSASPSMGGALEQLARYFGLITPWFRWELQPDLEPPRIRLISEHRGPEENLIFVQYILGVTFSRLRSAAARPLEFVDVSLAIPEPRSRERHEAFFACPLHYGTATSEVVMTRASWEAPSRRHEPGLRDVLERHAEDLMQQVRPDDSLAPIRVEIQRQLTEGAPKLGAVATALAMRSRTLPRRLRDEGSTIQQLVADDFVEGVIFS